MPRRTPGIAGGWRDPPVWERDRAYVSDHPTRALPEHHAVGQGVAAANGRRPPLIAPRWTLMDQTRSHQPVADAKPHWSTSGTRWVTARPAGRVREPAELKKRHQAVALDDTEDELCAPAPTESTRRTPAGSSGPAGRQPTTGDLEGDAELGEAGEQLPEEFGGGVSDIAVVDDLQARAVGPPAPSPGPTKSPDEPTDRGPIP